MLENRIRMMFTEEFQKQFSSAQFIGSLTERLVEVVKTEVSVMVKMEAEKQYSGLKMELDKLREELDSQGQSLRGHALILHTNSGFADKTTYGEEFVKLSKDKLNVILNSTQFEARSVSSTAKFKSLLLTFNSLELRNRVFFSKSKLKKKLETRRTVYKRAKEVFGLSNVMRNNGSIMAKVKNTKQKVTSARELVQLISAERKE